MNEELLTKLELQGRLEQAEFLKLIQERTPELQQKAAEKARKRREKIFGQGIFLRGLIEFSSYCQNDCYYCGLRRSNRAAERFRLNPEQIHDCTRRGHALGFRTFVLQSGEDTYWNDAQMVPLIKKIKQEFPDSAVTLSLGERNFASYQALRQAGADRYLLRHETATPEYYRQLHPPEMSWQRRQQCLQNLRILGYQVGAGFMVGSPGQTPEHLAQDLLFLSNFRPEMVGIGPFLPQHNTPLAAEPAGSVELTLFLISLLRLMLPNGLLPATTALGSLHPQGRELGILAGANVVMPNLSPEETREKYRIYDHKLSIGAESAAGLAELQRRLQAINCHVDGGRGDFNPAQEPADPNPKNRI